MGFFKDFKEDGRFDIISSGSMLGVHYKQIASIPVGYKTDYDLSSLDFEEFLWANGIDEPVIQYLKECLHNETPVAEALHEKYLVQNIGTVIYLL